MLADASSRLGFFASANADGSGTREQYKRQILSDSEAALPITPEVFEVLIMFVVFHVIFLYPLTRQFFTED